MSNMTKTNYKIKNTDLAELKLEPYYFGEAVPENCLYKNLKFQCFKAANPTNSTSRLCPWVEPNQIVSLKTAMSPNGISGVKAGTMPKIVIDNRTIKNVIFSHYNADDNTKFYICQQLEKDNTWTLVIYNAVTGEEVYKVDNEYFRTHYGVDTPTKIGIVLVSGGGGGSGYRFWDHNGTTDVYTGGAGGGGGVVTGVLNFGTYMREATNNKDNLLSGETCTEALNVPGLRNTFEVNIGSGGKKGVNQRTQTANIPFKAGANGKDTTLISYRISTEYIEETDTWDEVKDENMLVQVTGGKGGKIHYATTPEDEYKAQGGSLKSNPALMNGMLDNYFFLNGNISGGTGGCHLVTEESIGSNSSYQATINFTYPADATINTDESSVVYQLNMDKPADETIFTSVTSSNPNLVDIDSSYNKGKKNFYVFGGHSLEDSLVSGHSTGKGGDAGSEAVLSESGDGCNGGFYLFY